MLKLILYAVCALFCLFDCQKVAAGKYSAGPLTDDRFYDIAKVNGENVLYGMDELNNNLVDNTNSIEPEKNFEVAKREILER